MMTHEGDGAPKEFPPDEVAPTLSKFWDTEPHPPVHYSNLSADPEAKMDLRRWANLYYQMEALSLWDEDPAMGATSEVGITVRFPLVGLYEDSEPVTWLRAGVGGPLRDKGGVVEGWRVTQIKLDLTRPGYVEVSDSFTCLPEKSPTVTMFEAAGEVKERGGLYMAQDGSSIAVKDFDYVIGDEGADQLIELLRSATPLPVNDETIAKRFYDALEHMDGGLREACHRQFVLHKDLLLDPEEAFREPQYHWDYLPTSQPDGKGLIIDTAEDFVVCAPPGTVPCSHQEGFTLAAELRGNNPDRLWMKASWRNEDFPDNYHPMFDEPTSVEAVALADLVQDMPEEAKRYIAAYLQGQLSLRRSWPIWTANDIRTLQDVPDEATFQRRIKAAKEGSQHFEFQKFESRAQIMKHILNGMPHEDVVEYWEAMERAYMAVYEEYVELFPEFLEEYPASPDIYPAGMPKAEFLRALKDIDQEFRTASSAQN